MKVAIYKRSFYGKGYVRTGVNDLVTVLTKHKEDQKIKNYRATKTKDNPKGDRKLKAGIKAYMPSGDYGDGVARSIKNKLETATCLVQLDFDCKVSNKEIKTLFDTHEWIKVAGRSCGGEGFYILVNTPNTEHYEEYWQALVEFFKTKTKYTADLSVSSINEIRYLSLTTEVLIRETPTTWKTKKKKEVSTYTGSAIPHDSKLIKAEPESGLHYVDLVAISGLNNSNGVPKEDVMSYFTPDMFDRSSHLHSAGIEEIHKVIERVYERYSDQHGESVTPILATADKISLPPVKIPKRASMDYKALLVVKNIFESYLLKTDYKTKITYRYTGKFWQEVTEAELRNFLSACAFASRMDSELNETTKFRDLMLKQLQDITAAEFSVPLNKFNLANGVLEFAGGEVSLTEHSDRHLFTYVLEYNYEPEKMPSALLLNFLKRTIPDPDSLETLLQYIGTAFITEFKVEAFLILLGAGANGKSTLINLLGECFGGSVGSYSLDKLTDPEGEVSAKQARFIYNKVLGVSSEDSRIKDARLWRKIASKETIEVKSLYKDTFETTNYARLISCMNDTPYIDTIQGSIRRLIIIGTGASLKRSEYDMDLGNKLREELSAFLNLIVEGYRAVYAKRGIIKVSESAMRETAQVLDTYDHVLQFVRDYGYLPVVKPQTKSTKISTLEKYQDSNPGALVQLNLQSLYGQFQDWCEDAGLQKPIGRNLFKKRLTAITGERAGTHEDATFHSFMARVSGKLTEIYFIKLKDGVDQ